MFTGHEFVDGASKIKNTLKKHKINAGFFLTGDFYRKHSSVARSLSKDNHYMAPHSDKHLLYVDWSDRNKTLITKADFEKDLSDNYEAMHNIGIASSEPLYYIPPYEWYNQEISNWAKETEVQIINFTPGTNSNADYTTPEMTNYKSSKDIYSSILEYEDVNNLNGFILLIHIGTDSKRTDKLYNHLDELIKELKRRGYLFARIDKLLQRESF